MSALNFAAYLQEVGESWREDDCTATADDYDRAARTIERLHRERDLARAGGAELVNVCKSIRDDRRQLKTERDALRDTLAAAELRIERQLRTMHKLDKESCALRRHVERIREQTAYALESVGYCTRCESERCACS